MAPSNAQTCSRRSAVCSLGDRRRGGIAISFQASFPAQSSVSPRLVGASLWTFRRRRQAIHEKGEVANVPAHSGRSSSTFASSAARAACSG
jgi:hypothetical protein